MDDWNALSLECQLQVDFLQIQFDAIECILCLLKFQVL